MTIVVHVFPDEEQLWRDVRKTALAITGESRNEPRLRASVQRALQRWYPHLIISRKEELASLADECVWYVMRDGRVRPPREGVDRLYRAMSDARDTQEASDASIDRARATIELANRPRPPARERSGAGR